MRPPATKGKMYVVVIGIDRYRAHPKLENAVSDAKGAQRAFQKLGFEPRASLFDEQATRQAMEQLVQDDLKSLQIEDSLVVFFAGHGHTETDQLPVGQKKRGYLMPVDANVSHRHSWLGLSHWLEEVSHLPPRHILVILDACHSGIALDTGLIWRAGTPQLPEPVMRLRQRQSRRIITSALDDQQAMDSGPVEGHSLFTGCLIEALSGGVGKQFGFATSSNIGSYIQSRVASFPGSRQTPDFGTLKHDDRGELVVQLPWARIVEPGSLQTAEDVLHSRTRNATQTRGPDGKRDDKASVVSSGKKTLLKVGLPNHLDPGLVSTLDRHAAERKLGAVVLSVIAGEPQVAASELATWSAQRGNLTLVSQASRHETVVNDLLTYMPWSRCLSTARSRLSRAAGEPVDSIQGHLEARRTEKERIRWFEQLARGNSAVRVSGWLLSAMRQAKDGSLDLSTAPVQGLELLSVVGELMAPISILVCSDEPTEAWVREAIPAAAALTARLPWHSVAVAAPQALLETVTTGGQTMAMVIARQGLVRLRKPTPEIHHRGEDSLPSLAARIKNLEQVLFSALAKDARTKRARFEQRVMAPIYEQERSIEVALAARPQRLIVELDGWYHLGDPQAYRRERIKDVWLQHAGFFVMRFPAEDVERRLPAVIDEIAHGLDSRC